MTKVDAVEQSPVFLQKKIKLTFQKQKTNSMQIIKAYSLTIKRTANFKRMEEGRMETTIQNTGKKALKIAGAVCLAAGVVAVSALVASGAAAGAVVEGFKTAKNTMRRVLDKEAQDAGGETSAEDAAESEAAAEENA